MVAQSWCVMFFMAVWDLWCVYYLDAIRYMKLLVYDHYKFMLFCYPHGNRFFQQDNSTFHKPVWLLLVGLAFLRLFSYKLTTK